AGRATGTRVRRVERPAGTREARRSARRTAHPEPSHRSRPPRRQAGSTSPWRCCTARSRSRRRPGSARPRSACTPYTRRTRAPRTSAAGVSRSLLERVHFEPLDVRHLVLALPLGVLHGHGVADFLADQRARDGSADRDPTLLDVGLVLAHDRVTLRFSGLGVLDGHGGAEFDSRTREFGWIEDRKSVV